MPLAGLLFLAWLPGRLVFLALAAVPAGYLLAGAFADVFVPRYMIRVVPFALVLVPLPLAGLAGIWRHRESRRAAGPPVGVNDARMHPG